MSKSWRDIARPIIARVLQETDGQGELAVKAALREAYPFGERKYRPYKIWRDEIKIQLSKRTFGHRPAKPDPHQQCLF